MTRVFIDGKAGTTGLRIYERLGERPDIDLISLSEEERKCPEARRDALASADIAFLCLPDDAARESVALAEGLAVRILDTSTAHRTSPGWAYGFPELSTEHRQAVRKGNRVAVPGCHASGFIALAYPLVQAGLLDAEACVCSFSLTGYSGGGKKMIAQYEAQERPSLLDAPRSYGLTQQHKHLPEMMAISGLKTAPVFVPVVADYYAGMQVVLMLHTAQLKKHVGIAELEEVYRAAYQHPHSMVQVGGITDADGFSAANAMMGLDTMQVGVVGNEERILCIARFDNLGKGASGAAIQCMNEMLGLPAGTGLKTGGLGNE